MSLPKLFQPKQVGEITVQHRIVLAPLTRNRANKEHVHGDLAVEYYSQRASMPGTLLITEATYIARKAGGYPHVPGIWSEEQIAAWKAIDLYLVVEAVHARGSYIFLQLWALGGDKPSRLSSNPKAFLPHLKEYVQLYATAAKNAVHGAGFDGVEVHCANGYLPDQFLQDICNKRTDEYGGSVENRCRFPLEIVQAITEVVGVRKTGVRISPWGTFGGACPPAFLPHN
ncbi:FMN-linked oxidoreductase [Gloeophyllum trabeum ATCC 11539]|uniref:FMN-linked oxidoreductase n=1 Tax=Gloeophyllum trabeum (strain ATCC 11539 / FP-39264 / Madison 617) TaxID=670483 RepID=S7RAM9_GLOTA|nr:FMN-linked oxidoreductase [Gloeophyllum trabeum ATCC 11539]EPQ51315.1 FMN-linked oxidoreductase [Gloeophyllum trabeum ATCC 11539]